jgi:hypothetical protein
MCAGSSSRGGTHVGEQRPRVSRSEVVVILLGALVHGGDKVIKEAELFKQPAT